MTRSSVALAVLLFLGPPFLKPLAAAVQSTGSGAIPNDSGENGFGVSLTLFSTLAAINAAGYDAGMDSPLNQRYQLRSQIREALAKEKIGCLSELKVFYREHKKPSDTADLSQYISFALIAKGAPTFELPDAVPPDVESLRSFSELLSRFYKEAN